MNIKPAGAASSNAISQNTTNPQAEEDAKSALKDGAISLQEFNTQNNQQQTLDNAVHGSGMQSMTGDVAHGDEVDVTDNVDSGDDEVNLEDDVIDVSDGDIDVTENDEAPSVGFQQIGQREGLDYYRGVEDDVRAQFSNQNSTREYIEIDGNNADIDTGRGDDAAYLRGDNNRVEFGNGTDVGGTFGKDGRVFGEAGSDVLYGMGDRSAVYGGTGNDFVQVSGQSSVGYGDQGEDRVLTSGNGAYGFGGADNDTLVSLGTNGFIDGGEGDDKLIVAGLNNTAKGGAGDDEIAMVTRGHADGGDGNDSFLLKSAASGSTINGGAGKDAVHVETARDGGLDWDIEPKENGSENEFTFTVGDSVYQLNNIEDIHFSDGKSITLVGTQWVFTDKPAPEAPLTDRPDFSWPERVPEGALEPEQIINVSTDH